MIRCLLIAIVLLAGAVPALARAYWPDDPDGVVYRYRSNHSGFEYDAVFEVDGDFHHMSREWGACTGSDSYLLTDTGVGLAAWGYYCQGDIDPIFDLYSPPVDFLRDEMADGDTWM